MIAFDLYAIRTKETFIPINYCPIRSDRGIANRIIEYINTADKMREEVDKRLREMNSIACRTGIDSTPEEKTVAKAKIALLMAEIKEIDPTYWATIKQDEDETNT